LSLLKAKLSEYQDVEPEFRVVADREIARFGPFECQFFAVNHSIPDAMAVSIRTEAGLLFHTGDFKMDQLPLDGRLTDLPGFYMVGDQGVDLLLSGHTHGGQICLPRSIPITLSSVLPRRFGSGAWKYHNMVGYTSVGAGSSIVAVRINCLPEITLHHLQCC
jgi:hypothetical protein